MKKPLLFIALAAVFACKDKPKENKEEVQEEMTEIVEEKESEWMAKKSLVKRSIAQFLPCISGTPFFSTSL